MIKSWAEECYRQWYNLFFKISFNITQDREATEDLIHNSFLYVLQKEDGEIRELTHMKALIHMDLKFQSLKHAKGNKKVIGAPEQSVNISNYVFDMWPACNGIFKNVSKLTDNQQSLIKKHFYAGMTATEIAQESGKGESSVRLAIKRGLAFVKKGCQEDHKIPDNRDGNTEIIIALLKKGADIKSIAGLLQKNPKTIASRISYYRKTNPQLFN